MHELSICASMLDQLEAIAREHGGGSFRRIEVSIGPLSGVEGYLLRQAFEVARVGTLAERAELVLRHSDVRVRCEACDAESTVPPNRLLCGSCGEWRTRVVAGDEMLLQRVELETQEEASHV